MDKGKWSLQTRDGLVLQALNREETSLLGEGRELAATWRAAIREPVVFKREEA